jgi:hypothetical protein
VVGSGVVLLDPSFVGKKVAKEVIHGEWLEPGRDEGDKGVVFGTQICDEVRGELIIVEGLFGSSKSGRHLLDPLKIICDGGVSLLGSSELVMKNHGWWKRRFGRERQPSICGRRSSEMVAMSILRIS